MTTLFMDPFTEYGTGSVSQTNMLAGVFADVQTSVVGAASWDASGSLALRRSNDTGPRRVLPATKTSLIVSMRHGVNSITPFGGLYQLFQYRNGSNVAIATLIIESTGRISLYSGGSPFISPLATTSGPVVVAGNYQHFEFKLDISAGTFVMRVDDSTGTGTPVMNVSGLSLSNGPISQFTLACSGGSDPSVGYTKDLIVRDTAGSVNNGFNGDEHVAALFAVADTTTAGWTPRFFHEFGAGILSGASYSSGSSVSTDLGSGDYTLEGFFRWSSLPGAANYQTLFSKWDTANNKRSYRFIYGGSSFNANCFQFDISTDGASGTIATKILYPWVPDLNVWYHIALVRTTSELLLFVDGNQLGVPIADSATYYAGTEPTGVGVEVQGTSSAVANTNFSGWMDETRMTVGYARYTAPFSVPVVAFPRGSGSDAHWSNVALLAGYDSAIQDESSFGRTLTAQNSSVQYNVPDGPAIGSWSTLGVTKMVPDDNSFMTAPFTGATGILTMTVQPANNDTVTVGTTNGSTAAVYTFKNTLVSAFDVLIDTTAQNTLLNLYNAINGSTGAGTKYGTGTTANYDVLAIQLPAGQLEVSANTLGTVGNSIATSATGSAASWGGTHLTGGLNIPGPSDFKVQRPPPHTSIISAVQLNARMFKSDAGTCTVETGLVGPLGNVNYGAAHPLTISPVYYGDIVETDPDTGGPVTPTTIVGGSIRLNRTA